MTQPTNLTWASYAETELRPEPGAMSNAEFFRDQMFPSFDQLGVITPHAASTLRYWTQLGFRPWVVDNVEGEVWYRGKLVQQQLRLHFCRDSRGFELEVMEPIQGDGYQFEVWDRAAKLDPDWKFAVSHFGTHVDNINVALKGWEGRFPHVEVIQLANIGSHSYAYLDTAAWFGLPLKLIQRNYSADRSR